MVLDLLEFHYSSLHMTRELAKEIWYIIKLFFITYFLLLALADWNVYLELCILLYGYGYQLQWYVALTCLIPGNATLVPWYILPATIPLLGRGSIV